ncbi:MAG: YitT family protein [Bacteroidales bacterium]|nr:YitT family protein [Bacteroidales bacterium]
MQIFKKRRDIIMSYVVITLGLVIYTFAWSAFLLPSKIISGGVTGVSSILYFLTGERIPVGVTNLFLNAVLLLLGFKMLGSKFGANTIYGIVMSSLLFILWQQVLGIESLFNVAEFGNFMCAIAGGALCGIGIGMTFSMGGNSGGTDIVALIVSRYYNISPGKVIMFIDLVIIGCTFFVSKKLENVIFGYIVMVTMTYVLDMVLDGSKQSYQILVFSSQTESIGEAITKEVGRGATLLNGKGCYTQKNQEVLVIVAHKSDKPHIMQIIHRIDAGAFISVSKVQGVYGANFEKLKM